MTGTQSVHPYDKSGNYQDLISRINFILILVSKYGIVTIVNSKQSKTLKSIFTDPVLSSIPWVEIESLLTSLGADVREGSGSRVGFSLNGVDIILHRPHPRKETDKGAVKSIRKFLINAGVRP